MLALAALATVLIFIAVAAGSLFLGAWRLPVREAGDRFFIAVWIGLLLTGGLLTCAALLVPLNQIVFAAVLTAGGGIIFTQRDEIAVMLRGLALRKSPYAAFAAILIIVLHVSIHASRDTAHYDSGFYLLPQMIWLQDHGLVTGLGLLHHRFGYNSIWLSLAAPVTDLSHAGRLIAIGGTVCFSLMIVHIAYSAVRIVSGKSRAADWFLPASMIFGVASAWFSYSLSSSGPDFPAWMLIATFAWLLLVDKERQLGAQALMLATGAAAIKLTAAPLVPIALIYLMWTRQSRPRNLLAAGTFGLLTLGAVMAANFVTSGCLMFPAAFTCTPVSWTIPAQVTKAVSIFISQWPLIGNIDLYTGNDIIAYMNGKLPVFTLEQRAVLTGAAISLNKLILLILLVAAAIVSAFKLRGTASAFVLPAALAGLAYCAMVPSLRFAVGYIGILSGLVVAALAASMRIRFSVPRKAGIAMKRQVLVLLACASIPLSTAFSSVVALRDRELSESGFAGRPVKLMNRLWLPPEVLQTQPNPEKGIISETWATPLSERVKWIEAAINDVKFVRPEKGDQCWDVRRPCSPPGEPFTALRLRNPERGLAAGFVRAD